MELETSSRSPELKKLPVPAASYGELTAEVEERGKTHS
jgi:hypothetical protein